MLKCVCGVQQGNIRRWLVLGCNSANRVHPQPLRPFQPVKAMIFVLQGLWDLSTVNEQGVVYNVRVAGTWTKQDGRHAKYVRLGCIRKTHTQCVFRVQRANTVRRKKHPCATFVTYPSIKMRLDKLDAKIANRDGIWLPRVHTRVQCVPPDM